MSQLTQDSLLEAIVESIEVTKKGYENAETRYNHIGKWLNESPKSTSAQYDPHIFPQGSFRLGTAIKPWAREAFDLDLACELRVGLTKQTTTQEKLKNIVGEDLERYRKERAIHEALEEKHRCWRLNYQDEIKFHIDSVPCIPEQDVLFKKIQQRMIEAGSDEQLAIRVAGMSVAITDDRDEAYDQYSDDWPVSNPEGFALWFEVQMNRAGEYLEQRKKLLMKASVDELKPYERKTPLQQCVQLLKRHRDVSFEKNPDSKPISVIITTLAARAYQGESNLTDAMDSILARMGDFVRQQEPRVPNPVNPREDFADKWKTEEGKKLELEKHFRAWLKDAQDTFAYLNTELGQDGLKERVVSRFKADTNEQVLRFQSRANDLKKKAALIKLGASTSSSGVIGTEGIKNKTHKFFGDNA